MLFTVWFVGLANKTLLLVGPRTTSTRPTTPTRLIATNNSAMERLRRLLNRRTTAKDIRDATSDEYEPLRTSNDEVARPQDNGDGHGDGHGDGDGDGDGEAYHAVHVPFSWFEYTIFALVGVAMLWAW